MLDEKLLDHIYELNNEHIKAIRRHVYKNTNERDLSSNNSEAEFLAKFLAMFIDQFIAIATMNDPNLDINDKLQYKEKYLVLAIAVLPDIVTRYQERILNIYKNK